MLRFSLALLLAASSVQADCSLSQTKDDGGETIVMENRFIRVKILPESNGRIAEYTLKGAQRERSLFSKLVFETFDLTPDVKTVTSTNYAGLEDWIWEVGLVKKWLQYAAKVVKDTKEEVAVELALKASGYDLRRTVTIRADSAELDVTVELMGKDGAKRNLSYWPHTCLALDGEINNDQTRIFVPTAPQAKPERRANVRVQAVGQEEVYSRVLSAKTKDTSDFFAPAQPWWAMARNGLMLGMQAPKSETDRDGAYYSYASPDCLTMEVVYNSHEFSAGVRQSCHLTFLACEGLERVDYLDRHLAFAIDREKIQVAGNDVTLPVRMAGLRVLKNARLDLVAVGKDGKELAKGSLPIPEATPVKPLAGEVRLNGVKGTGAGLKFRLSDEKGRVVSEERVLGVPL